MLHDNISINAAGHLAFAGQDTIDLCSKYGTPLMLIDEDRIRANARTYIRAMQKHFTPDSHPLLASKALCFKGIYKIAAQEGMYTDIVSPGELYIAHAAGFPMENAFFHGNNKTDAAISLAMDLGLGYFIVDNREELEEIHRQATQRGIVQKILLRLSPGIDPHTHAKISTGKVDSKFGTAIETGQAEELIKYVLTLPSVSLEGLHCHIGSQIFDCAPFCDAAIMMLQFMADMTKQHGFDAPVLNLGGGMGVPYIESDDRIDYAEATKNIGALIFKVCTELDLTPPAILFEPGRSIVADAGITLYTVTGTKEIPGFKNFAAVDGGMSDNPRFALYQSDYTALLANRMTDKADFCCTVAGCCCESGDLIQEDVLLPKPNRGDTLAILTTGAYNYSMASNYNRIPRPPVVMLTENSAYIAVRRETLSDLLNCDA